MIPFNRPPYTGREDRHVLKAMRSSKLSGGDSNYSKRCQAWFEEHLGCRKSFLTPSCTQALEMAAMLIDIKPGDEVIMPSYTFVSSANAFVLRGAKIVFVDIRPETMNIDERLIEAAITEKTKAIVPVHYAGVACNMDAIAGIASRSGLAVIEDAAQGMMATYQSRPLGTLGNIGSYSFHETKNYTSGGEGGLLIINEEAYIERAEIIREKGTNRNQFFRGMVDKYTWIDIGSSYLPSEIQAAYLYGQLEMVEEINSARRQTWFQYYKGLKELEDADFIDLPFIPGDCRHNGHMFYLKVKNLAERAALIDHLSQAGIQTVFHYVPLHSSPGGKKYGRFNGMDKYTTVESERLLRLPVWYGMTKREVEIVIDGVKRFFKY